jgi:hypothetical protein
MVGPGLVGQTLVRQKICKAQKKCAVEKIKCSHQLVQALNPSESRNRLMLSKKDESKLGR